jgi:hypothetical protein
MTRSPELWLSVKQKQAQKILGGPRTALTTQSDGPHWAQVMQSGGPRWAQEILGSRLWQLKRSGSA